MPPSLPLHPPKYRARPLDQPRLVSRKDSPWPRGSGPRLTCGATAEGQCNPIRGKAAPPSYQGQHERGAWARASRQLVQKESLYSKIWKELQEMFSLLPVRATDANAEHHKHINKSPVAGSARAGTKRHGGRPQGKDRGQTRRMGRSLHWPKLGVGTARLLCYSSYFSLHVNHCIL